MPSIDAGFKVNEDELQLRSTCRYPKPVGKVTWFAESVLAIVPPAKLPVPYPE
jgi:hypothetical protein